MHGAVSAAVESSTTRNGRKSRPVRERNLDSAHVIEITRELEVVPFADLRADVRPVEHVMPAERSESLSRALNVVIAVVGLICASPLIHFEFRYTFPIWNSLVLVPGLLVATLARERLGGRGKSFKPEPSATASTPRNASSPLAPD